MILSMDIKIKSAKLQKGKGTSDAISTDPGIIKQDEPAIILKKSYTLYENCCNDFKDLYSEVRKDVSDTQCECVDICFRDVPTPSGIDYYDVEQNSAHG